MLRSLPGNVNSQLADELVTSADRRVAGFFRACFNCLSKLRMPVAWQKRMHAETPAASTGNETGRAD